MDVRKARDRACQLWAGWTAQLSHWQIGERERRAKEGLGERRGLGEL